MGTITMRLPYITPLDWFHTKISTYRTMGSRDTTLVSNQTLVAYQGKPVSLPPERSPHGMTVEMF